MTVWATIPVLAIGPVLAHSGVEKAVKAGQSKQEAVRSIRMARTLGNDIMVAYDEAASAR